MASSPRSTLPPLSPHSLPEKRHIPPALAGSTAWALRQVDCQKVSTRTRYRGGERRFGGSASRKWSERAKSSASGRWVPISFSLCPLNTSSRLLPACCVDGGTGWVEIEGRKAHIVVDLQARVRSPRLDTFFLQTSMLAHTFFLMFLPMSFFGHDILGRG